MNKPSRQLAYKRRQQAAGLKQVSVWAHPDDVDQIKALAAQMAGDRKSTLPEWMEEILKD